MLTIYRRHVKGCPYRSQGRKHLICRCPLWADSSSADVASLAGFLGRYVAERADRCSLGTADWGAAQKIVLDWEAGGRRAYAPTSVQNADERITVSAACKAFVDDAVARNLSDGWIGKYRLLRRELEEFSEARGIHHLVDLDLAALSAFRASWKMAPLSASKKLERLRSLFSFAEHRGWVSSNPAKAIKSPRVSERPTMPFTHEEMTRILAAAAARVETVHANGKENARRIRALILLLRYSGLRLGDAVRVSTEMLVDGKLRLRTAKTGTHVCCPLPDFVVKELDATPRTSERFWFWSGYSKAKSVSSNWGDLLRKVFDDAGLPAGHAHRFRDTFAVDLLLAGVPIERVSALLGHSSIRITEKHYAPWVVARQEQAEADVRRAWLRDPLALMEGAVGEQRRETRSAGTRKVHEKTSPRYM